MCSLNVTLKEWRASWFPDWTIAWGSREIAIFKIRQFCVYMFAPFYTSFLNCSKSLKGLPRWRKMIKNLPANAGDAGGKVPRRSQPKEVWSLGWEDPLEDEMATHSSTLAWEIPWTEEPGGLQSMGSQRVGHDWSTEHTTHTQVTTSL